MGGPTADTVVGRGPGRWEEGFRGAEEGECGLWGGHGESSEEVVVGTAVEWVFSRAFRIDLTWSAQLRQVVA